MANLEDYPLKATCSARDALVRELARHLKTLRFALPSSTQPFQFQKVFASWEPFAGASEAAPVAAVLPDRHVYEDNGLGTDVIDRTWSGGDPCIKGSDGLSVYPIGDGSGDGFALWTSRDVIVPIVLVYRCDSKAQRSAVEKRLEEVFHTDGSLVPDATSLPQYEDGYHPVRDCLLLTLRDYYSQIGRYEFIAQTTLDTEISVVENRWMGQAEITAQTQVCRVRRARELTVKFQAHLNDEEIER